MVRKGITTWNAAVTSGAISTGRHAACVIVVMAPDMFTAGLAANAVGRESSRERPGTNSPGTKYYEYASYPGAFSVKYAEMQ